VVRNPEGNERRGRKGYEIHKRAAKKFMFRQQLGHDSATRLDPPGPQSLYSGRVVAGVRDRE
jgi:hypothetical protein